MRAGRLRTRITIQQLAIGSPQQKPSGAPDAAWATYCEVYASIDPIIGREYFAAQQVQSEVDTKIRVRYMTAVTAGITAAMRVSAGGVIYTIKAVIDVENRHRELLLMCSSGANLG